MNKLLFIVCTYWVLLFNNSRMEESLPSYDVLRFFRVPRQLRFLEIAVLVIIYLRCVRLRMPAVAARVNVFTVAFIGVAAAGLVFAHALGFDNVQEVYLRAVPLLVFIIAATIGVTREDLRQLVRFYVGVTMLGIMVAAFYQIPFHGQHEDFINGIFSDAHILGALAAICAIGCLSHFVETRRTGYLVASLFLWGFGIFPKNEKVFVLAGCWYFMVFMKEWALKQRGLMRFVLVTGALGMVAYGFVRFDELIVQGSGLRIRQLLELGVGFSGPVVAWPIAFEQLGQSLTRFLFGLGAGEFGWIAAFRTVSSGGGSEAAQTFSLEFSFNNVSNSGFLFRTNTWSSLLAEFGVLGFLAFAAALLTSVNGVLRTRAVDAFDRTMQRVFVFSLMIVVFQGFFTPFSNWSESILMFPLMYIAAYFSRREPARTSDGESGEQSSKGSCDVVEDPVLQH